MQGLKDNTIREVNRWICQQISPVYHNDEAKNIASLVVEHFLGFSSADLIMNPYARIGESEIVTVYKVIRKLRNNVPVQHITGVGFFRDLKLQVNKHVLIPRGETEELVQWVVDDYPKTDPIKEGISLKIWDIGTGSGAIALSLAQELANASLFASDVSREALKVAEQNALRHGLDVQFFHHDILVDDSPDERFNYLVSNPPYVKDAEKSLMMANVLDYEPHKALFVSDDDPLIFYRAIAQTARRVLTPCGWLYVEINEALGPETAGVFRHAGLSRVEIKKDIHGKDRFIKAMQPEL